MLWAMSSETPESGGEGTSVGDAGGSGETADGSNAAAGGGSAVTGRRPTGVHRLLNPWTAGVAGVAVTTVLAGAGFFWPALTVLGGAVTASGLLLARRGGKKHYVVTGVVYFLGLALVIEGVGSALPAAYESAVLPAAGGIGAISGILVVAKVSGKRVVKRVAELAAYDEEYWGEVWDALAAYASLLSMVWLLVTFTEKVMRYASVSIGAVGLLIANMLGYRVPVTFLGFEIEAVTAMFVGCVLVWFHLLDTLHSSWRAVAYSAEKAADRAGRSAEEESASGAES
jgi:hypothetical protein